MAERPRELRDFKGVGSINLRLKFRLNGYVSRRYLWAVRGEWSYYNIAAGSFHIKKHVNVRHLYSTEVEFYSKH